MEETRTYTVLFFLSGQRKFMMMMMMMIKITSTFFSSSSASSLSHVPTTQNDIKGQNSFHAQLIGREDFDFRKYLFIYSGSSAMTI